MNRILLLGANGQVGWELRRSLAPLGQVIACSRAEADLGRPEVLDELVARQQPRIIVNAAAYTAVDRAESEQAAARRVNAEAVAQLAAIAAKSAAWLVHYSTDYVFDGSSERPYRESDPVRPISVYGRTKREGEEAIIASGCRHLILRTSWVYAARGNNFARTMLRLAAERDQLKVVSDQVGAPTSAELIADASALALYRLRQDAALARRASGIYHLVAGGEISWYAYARHVISCAEARGWVFRVPSGAIRPIASADYPTPARRPANSRLNTSKIQRTFDLHLPAWQDHVDRMLEEILDDPRNTTS